MRLLRRLTLSIVAFLGIFLIFPINYRVPLKDYYLAFDIKNLTPLSPLYYLKISREFMQSKFVFGSEDLSYWYFKLAEKRIKEAQVLKSHNLTVLARQHLQIAKDYQSLGEKYLQDLLNKTDVNYLIAIKNSNDQLIKMTE